MEEEELLLLFFFIIIFLIIFFFSVDYTVPILKIVIKIFHHLRSSAFCVLLLRWIE